jgi:hypothetical protein
MGARVVTPTPTSQNNQRKRFLHKESGYSLILRILERN